MIKVNWEWLENMVKGVAKNMPDGDEFESFAMAWIYQQLQQYFERGNTNPPNWRNLVYWSLGHYRRSKRLHDDDVNIGRETNFVSTRISPADQVALRLDIAEFLEKLNENQKLVFRMTIEGYSTAEIAGVLKKSPGRVSQLRAEVADKAKVHLIEYY